MCALRLHHIVLSIRRWGGPAYTVPRLCISLTELGNDVVLHALSPGPDEEWKGIRVEVHPRTPAPFGLGISPQMKAALREAARVADFLHSHSLWAMPNVYPAASIRGTRCRLLVSPRGTLDPWAVRHHKWRKKIMWHLGQKANLVEASCLHATAEQEHRFIREMGLKAPVALIPNGVDIPPPRSEDTGEGSHRRRLLFLARIHPKKGVDILLHAWRRIQDSFPDWELHVAGPDNEDHLPAMQRLSAALGNERVTFTGWLPEKDKSSTLWSAELYILPTHAENWGVSVAEALAHGLPAIVGQGAPWKGLEDHACGWWIDNSIESVTECLRSALALSPEELRRRGERGREWMARDYPWSMVGRMMHDTYRWLLDGGPPPPWVRLD